ncbi:uncharacterized protein LOC108917896 [Anoplophora glabripennis]|uniref:uncharacterized protein LOC108917896 n=1 Tax=Anoplophora glabripennis TaxID=217634 RepID=UPI0008751A02|nr:uncharacterized protein LOC108917896 [Anoplophora glabripennis]
MDFKNCNDYEILAKINGRKLFRYPLKYLFLVNVIDYSTFLKKLDSLSLLIMSEVVVASFGKESIDLYQPYKIQENESLIVENYGIWTENTGIRLYYDGNSFAKRRRDFRKLHITVSAVVHNIENVKLKDFDDIPAPQEDEPYFSQDMAIINNLMQYLNASYSLKIFDSYGYLNRTTGKFDGMVEDIYEERSDISIYVILSEERHAIVDFIKPAENFATKTKFILKKPAMSYIENIYYVTFTGKVWISSLAILGTLSVSLYVLLNWEAKHMNRKSSCCKYTFSDITLISLEAVCQQGTMTDSSTYSGRTIIFLFFTAFMFLYVAYSAYILVLLQSTKPITSIRHLVESRVECGGLNLSYTMAYYESTKDEALRDLYRKKIYPNRFYSLQDGLNKVQEGNFAFQVILGPAYNYILKTYTNYDICKIQELPGYMNTIMSPTVPKSSQYKKLFKIGLTMVEERGLQHRIKNRVSIRPRCYNEAGNFQSVRIYDCHSVFILFAMGVALAFGIFWLEIFVEKYYKRQKK